MTFMEDNYREIITKAVCGKGNKFTKAKHKVTPPHKPSSILGCWIINHKYKARKVAKNKVEVTGSYDINIWYSYHKNTKTEAITERVTYTETIPLSERDKKCFRGADEVIVKVTQQPNCLECQISKCGEQIIVEVERGFTVKLLGETKVYVRVDPSYHTSDDFYEDYDSHDHYSKSSPDFLPEKKHK
ncbi:MAG TPA: outer spore coat protein CotE [Bacillota bacterium]|nr:outer spore coat protein CotE [Bacillota bacterium]